jgi:hypothetical protein
MADENQTSGDHDRDNDNKCWNDELNELTLSVMANRSKYDKCKKTLANTAQDTFRKEKMYYKERILNMTQDLFHERCENDNINDAHQAYIKSCIEYLKWNDITDMVSDDKRNELRNDDIIQARIVVQQKIQTSSLIEQLEHNADADADADTDVDKALSPPPSPPTHSQTQNIMSIANKMCIRKKTIDDFIVMKPRIDNIDHDRLPKVRDYQTEITKRVAAAAEAAAAEAAERLT